jgi:hypothetical protein
MRGVWLNVLFQAFVSRNKNLSQIAAGGFTTLLKPEAEVLPGASSNNNNNNNNKNNNNKRKKSPTATSTSTKRKRL